MASELDDEKRPLLQPSCKQEPPERVGSRRSGPPWACHRLITVEPVVILHALATYTTLPLLQQYIYAEIYKSHNVTQPTDNVTCGAQDSPDDDTDVVLNEISVEISTFNTLLTIAALLPGLFVLFFLGPYSDHLGRRAIIIPPLCGALISHSLYVTVAYFEIDLSAIVVATLLGALFGGQGCILSGAYSYVADITTHAQRTTRLVIIEVGAGLAVLVGQLTIGYIIKHLGFLCAFVLELGIHVVLAFYAIFFLPETIERTKLTKKCQCPDLTQSAKLYIHDDGSRRRLSIQLGTIVVFFIGFLDSGAVFVLNFYLLDPPLCLDSRYIGAFNGLTFIIKALGSLIMTKALIGRFTETTLVLIGCISGLVYFLVLSFSFTTAILFTAAVLCFGLMVPLPTLRSVMSKLVATDEQGALFAALGIIQTISYSVSSVLYNVMYATFTHYLHGLIWIVSAATMLIPIIVTVILKWEMSKAVIPMHRRNLLRRPTVHITSDHESSQEVDFTQHSSSSVASRLEDQLTPYGSVSLETSSEAQLSCSPSGPKSVGGDGDADRFYTPNGPRSLDASGQD